MFTFFTKCSFCIGLTPHDPSTFIMHENTKLGQKIQKFSETLFCFKILYCQMRYDMIVTAKGVRKVLFFYLSMLETPEDSAKFEQIYLTYRDQMIRIASKILKGNHYDAEDAVHDAFVTLTKHINDLPDHDSEYTRKYVYKMAKNAALVIYRKRYGEKETVSLQELFDYPDHIDIPAECANRELVWILIRTLNEMPDSYREVLSMYWLDEFKPAKIAKLLHRPIQTVYKQIQRGNQILREQLGKEIEHNDTATNPMCKTSTDGHRAKRNAGV